MIRKKDILFLNLLIGKVLFFFNSKRYWNFLEKVKNFIKNVFYIFFKRPQNQTHA